MNLEPDIRTSLKDLHQDAYIWAISCANGDHEEASEILQSAYMKILQSKAKFGGRSTFKTWWFGVIRNTARDHQRRAWYRKALLIGWAKARPEPSQTSPETETILGEQALQIRAALTELPDRQREVIELVFYHDLSLGEACEVMGVTVGTARTHYHRGKEALRTALGQEPS